MVFIKKIKKKSKRFLDKKAKNVIYLRTKQNKIYRTNLRRGIQFKKKKNRKSSLYKQTAPVDFRIGSNSEKVIGYFREIIDILRKRKNDITIEFDMSMVEEVTVGSIMYLLALMTDFKAIKPIQRISFKGILPKKQKAREYFLESGFLEHIYNQSLRVTPKSKKIQIKTGNSVDPETLRMVCDFVNSVCETTKSYTQYLYSMLIELMTNTVDHAYRGEVYWQQRWFLYVEEKDNYIEFVFMDTGIGIPSTVKKKLIEKFIGASDSTLIESALKGDFRTQTNEKKRGKGLPCVLEYSLDGNIDEMNIYSNKGFCKVNKLNRKVDKIALRETLHGTLFSWRIMKRA